MNHFELHRNDSCDLVLRLLIYTAWGLCDVQYSLIQTSWTYLIIQSPIPVESTSHLHI
ncbi:unnamed protein product [Prunus brigantina]